MSNTPQRDLFELVLDGQTDIIIRRSFGSAPDKVWHALTDADLIPHWMALRDPMIACQIDLRSGGSFRYDWAAFAFWGSILAVDAPHHMTHIEYFSADATYCVTVTTDLLPDATGGTMMKMVKHYPTNVERAAAIENDMTDGLADVFAMLDVISAPK
jgi:uncharacterized protein YndB with AHSA1/START domain